MAILAVQAFGGCFDNRLLPKELAIGAIEAEEETFLGFWVGGDGENLSTADDWGGVSVAGQWGAPEDIFGFTPVGRKGVFGASAVAVWSSPLGPVFGMGGDVDGEEKRKQEEKWHWGMGEERRGRDGREGVGWGVHGLEVDLSTKPLDPFVAGFDNFLPGPAGTHFKDEEHFFR